MTGGGFAGCAVALVDATAIDRFSRAVIDGYHHEGLTARVWPARPAAGASLIDDRSDRDRALSGNG
jgi:galactokinase